MVLSKYVFNLTLEDVLLKIMANPFHLVKIVIVKASYRIISKIN
jgi:hypothetical protein